MFSHLQSKVDHTREVLSEACRHYGMRLMNAAPPEENTLASLPMAATSFAAGWTLQFWGHALQKSSRSPDPTAVARDPFAEEFANLDEDAALIMG